MFKSPLRGFSALAVVLGLVGCGGGGSGAGGMTTAPSTTPPTNNPPPAPTPAPTPAPAPVTSSTTVVGQAIVASAVQQQVAMIDLSTGTQTASVALSGPPTSVAVNGTHAWVAQTNQTISCVDLLTNTVAYTMTATGAGITNLPLIGPTIDPLLDPLCTPSGVAVTPNGQKAYSANLINVTSYDLVNKKALNSIFSVNVNLQAIQSNPTAFLAQSLEAVGQARVACTNTTAFVTNMGTNNVTVIDTSNDSVVTYTPVGTLPIGVACANGKTYVACALTNDIWVLDGTTGAVKTHFSGGQVPVDVASSPSGDQIYVANLLSGDITVVDTTTDLPVNTLPVGLSLSGVMQQLGIPTAGGITSLVNTFLQSTLSSLSTVIPSLTTLLGGTGPTGVSSVLSGLVTSFLSQAGITPQALQGLTTPAPGIGLDGVSVTLDGQNVLGANLLFGLTITNIASQNVTAPGILTGQGIGADAVAAH